MKIVNFIKQHKIVLFVAVFLIVTAFLWTFSNSFSEDNTDIAWDGVVANQFTSGTGTVENPYVISSASEYAYFKTLMEGNDASVYANKNYLITNGFNYGEYDIAINNDVPFSGTIDGEFNAIYNANVTNSLFKSLDNATIKNINLSNLNITFSENSGVISKEMTGSNIRAVSLYGSISKDSGIETPVNGAGFTYSDNGSSFNDVVISITSVLDSYVSLVYETEDSTFENVFVANEYDYVNGETDIDLTKVYRINADGNNDNLISSVDNEEYELITNNNMLIFAKKNNTESQVNVPAVDSPSISVHDKGIDTAAKSIYVNDLASDLSYYKGLNYTEIRNTDGSIPDGTNQNLYNDSNLATVYIRYTSSDINDASLYGSVSVSEDIRNYYYYKRFPVSNGKVTFDLIDNPWANRPNGMAFNGWVTDYTNAVISLDMDVYVRRVEIPVSDISQPISITFYTSWTIASVATTTGEISTNLKSVSMQAVPGYYGDLTIYYIQDRINRYEDYPSGTLYTTGGTRITASTCNTYGGCTFLRPNTSNVYDSSASYYTVTPTGTNSATVTRVYPSRVSSIGYYGTDAYAAGLFVRVTTGSDNIYSNTGAKLTSCSGTCYKLLQFSDGAADPDTTYYYLVTRDTNIFTPSSTDAINTGNISTNYPMTITGINNGTDNSNNRSIYLNGNWTINSDLRVEFIEFYVNSTTTNVSEYSTDGYKIIGNYKNVKLGRGLKRNNTYLTATSFVGGSGSSNSSLEKYTFIVESGFYQNGSGVGYATSSYWGGVSVPTHYVQGDITLGNDYDRIDENNDDLIIYYCYSGTWGSYLYNSTTESNSYGVPAVYTKVKSGSFGYNKADYAAGVYVGGRASGTHYAIRSVLVEGGYIYNLLGGPMSDDARASKNDVVINVKGGNIDMIFGGAGVSNTVGNRILNITGGTINYSILGGSNAFELNNSNNPYGKIDGDTLLYVGGGAKVGTTNTSLYNIAAGNVFGAGNGRSGELDVGSVNNSNVIIDVDAKISGDVYGGGNFGAVGGNNAGNSGGGGSQTPPAAGVYEDGTVDNNIRYYGANPDNYIMFNGETYRIIGLFNNVSTTDGNKNLVRIVKNTYSSNGQYWNNSYITSGNNRYYDNYFVRNDAGNTKSYMYDYLNSTYYGTINNAYRNYIQSVNWSLGATESYSHTASEFYTAERGNTPSSDNAVTSFNYNIGLFYPSDFGFAVNDSACSTVDLYDYDGTSACYNNNWLNSIITSNAWTMTSSTYYTTSTSGGYGNRRTNYLYNVFYLNTGNYLARNGVYSGNSYRSYAVYPSFYLKDNVTIASGTGTSDDPYVIGESDKNLATMIYEMIYPPATPDPGDDPSVSTHDDSEYEARTYIKVLGGTVTGSVYGAGNSNGAGGPSKLSKIEISVDGGDIDGSVYGGANTKGTVYGDVVVNVINGDVAKSVYGGGKGGYASDSDPGTYVTDNVTVNIGDSTNTTNLKIHGSVYGGSAFGTVNAADQETTTSSYGVAVTVNKGVITGSVFGGGQGDATHTPGVVGNINVEINGGDITSVFGGNDQAGIHNKSNVVNLNGGTIQNVYGGGNKSSVVTTHVNLQGATVTNLFGGSNSLGDVTTANVQIKSGTVQNVYGGNNDGGTCGVTNVKVEGTGKVNGSLYGGGNNVATTTSNVTLNSAGGTIPRVFGGGNNASVTTTNITENGVNVTNMFGGSNSAGTVVDSYITYTSGTTTNVYGGNNDGGSTVNSHINTSGGNITTIFGGGNKANGDTSNINVTAGTVGTIFGGGNSAGLTTSNITIDNGNITDIYGGSNNSGKVTTTNITVNNTSSAVSNVYGGGNKAEVGDTNITVNNGTFGNIYGGGNLAAVSGNTLLDINGGTVNTNIYGGGNFGVVNGSSNVTITDATIRGSAYAGGNGESATLLGNTNITIDGNTVVGTPTSVAPAAGSVFGGGNHAYTGSSSAGNSVSNVNIAGGTFYGNIYGGANTSVIYGNTIVNIGKSAANYSSLEKEDIYIKGNIFGGGEANSSGSSDIYDWSFESVTDGVHITIDAEDYTNFDIDGSFFGGGNAAKANGDTYLVIKNYGTEGDPEHNISIQRVTYVTIDNSSILLAGAIDRANDYDTELFSISRVDDLKLKNNSSIYFATGANLLKKFESLDASDNYAVVTINEETGQITKTVDNRVYIFEGKNVNIATDQQATETGEVLGMSFMGIFNYDNDGNVNTGIYDSSYANGDTLDWSGVFSKGSYVLGSHMTNHDIKVNGFYSHYIDEDTETNIVKYVVPTPESGPDYMWYIGENVIEYNVNLVASKYSTLGSVEFSFRDFTAPNTSFQITSFDGSNIATGISLVDKSEIPRIASNANDANNKFGLAMEASNSGWLTFGKTSFYTREPSINGVTYYEGENSTVVPTMLFYLYHSKNLSEAKDLGTARISVMAITKINAISNEIHRFVINVNMSSALFQTAEYEGSMTPGDKYELFTSTSTNITTKSKFSAYYALYGEGTNLYKPGYYRALTSSFVLPVGTKITMLDFLQGNPEYYYHVIDSSDVTTAEAEFASEGECSYLLSMFTRMGSKSNNSNYDDAAKNAIYYDGNDSSEEFIFIVDFSDTNIAQDKLNNSFLIEIRDSNDESIISVLGIQHDQLKYNLYANRDSSIDLTATPADNPLYIGYNDVFDVTINYQSSSLSGVSITDTQYFDSKLGVQIFIKNNEGHIVSGTDLTGSYFVMDGVTYYPDISGYTHIKLADKVGNTEKWITFNTENSSLATGDYTFVFEAFASPDGIYYSSGEPDMNNVPLTIINSTFGLNPVIDDNSVIYSGSNNNKNFTFTINYTSLLDNPNIRIAMYRRKYDEIYDTDYELVDFKNFANQTLGETSNEYEYMVMDDPAETFTLTYNVHNTLTTGTYRLSFRLYDDDTLIGEIIRYIIVK